MGTSTTSDNDPAHHGTQTRPEHRVGGGSAIEETQRRGTSSPDQDGVGPGAGSDPLPVSSDDPAEGAAPEHPTSEPGDAELPASSEDPAEGADRS